MISEDPNFSWRFLFQMILFHYTRSEVRSNLIWSDIRSFWPDIIGYSLTLFDLNCRNVYFFVIYKISKNYLDVIWSDLIECNLIGPDLILMRSDLIFIGPVLTFLGYFWSDISWDQIRSGPIISHWISKQHFLFVIQGIADSRANLAW